MLVAGDVAHARAFAEEVAAFADGPRRSSILGQLAEFEGQHRRGRASCSARPGSSATRHADPVLAGDHRAPQRLSRAALAARRGRRDVVPARARAWRRATRSRRLDGDARAQPLAARPRRGGLRALEAREDRRRGRRPRSCAASAAGCASRADEIEAPAPTSRPRPPASCGCGALLFGSVRLTVLARLQYVDRASGPTRSSRPSGRWRSASEAEHPHSRVRVVGGDRRARRPRRLGGGGRLRPDGRRRADRRRPTAPCRSA